MFSMCSELTPRARIPDTRIPQFMQPYSKDDLVSEKMTYDFNVIKNYEIVAGIHRNSTSRFWDVQ